MWSNWYLAKVKAHLEALQVENDHLSREIAILRETVKVNLHISLKSKRTNHLLGLNSWDGGEKTTVWRKHYFGAQIFLGLVIQKIACDFYEVASNDVKGQIKRCGRWKRVYIIQTHLSHLLKHRIPFLKKNIWLCEIFFTQVIFLKRKGSSW